MRRDNASTEGAENKGQDDSDEAREEGEGLPSSYCTMWADFTFLPSARLIDVQLAERRAGV